MPSDLQVSNIRDLTNANSAISIASDGQVTISQNNPTITLGTNTRLPQGSIANVHCSTPSSTSAQTLANTETTVLTGSNVSYTPATGARYIVYEYRFQLADKSPSQAIWSGQLQLNDSGTYRNFVQRVMGGRYHTSETGNSSIVTVAIDLANLDTYFPGISSSHDWKTKAGGTSAFSANTLQVVAGQYDSNYTVELHKIYNSANSGGIANTDISPTTIIYSVM